MRNLFVCHTQAQLILASGLALGRFADCENHLVLFKDFLLKDELRERLDSVFDKVLYLQGIYPMQLNTFKAKLKNYPVNDRKMRELMQSPYDKVFTICDTIYPEQKCMQLAYRLNEQTEFCWLEDGILAYYANVIINKGLSSNSFLKSVRCCYFKYLKGLGKFYDRDFAGFGGSVFNKTIYCLYPEAVREPYKSQRTVQSIRDSEYLQGLNAIYSRKELPIKEGNIILLMDKFETYVYPEKVKRAVASFIEKNISEGKRIFCKFHPRESEKWDIFEECETIDNTVGAENLFLSLADKANDITVVGVKSAAVMSARKLGFNTASLFPSCGEENPDLTKFFTSVGILLI